MRKHSPNRTEALSDGVFAIALTLLVLEIHLPEHEAPLAESLLGLWPSYFAFALSFFVLLVTWVNHHGLMRIVRGETRRMLLANGLLLFYVSFLPFPTAVLASHLLSADVRLAVTFYCATFTLGSLAWFTVVRALDTDSLLEGVPTRVVAELRRGVGSGLLANVVALVLAVFHPWLALGLSVSARLGWLVANARRR
jgi:uncharacterized membrane protein